MKMDSSYIFQHHILVAPINISMKPKSNALTNRKKMIWWGENQFIIFYDGVHSPLLHSPAPCSPSHHSSLSRQTMFVAYHKEAHKSLFCKHFVIVIFPPHIPWIIFIL